MPPPAENPDRLPWIVAGVVGLLLVALIVVFVVTSNNNNANNPPQNNVAANPPATSAPAADNGQPADTAPPAPAATGSDPPRISLETFKKLYDDPKTRPPIYDVRAIETYQQGHIVGSLSLPEADVDTRYQEVPKDKLVVLYCQ